MPFSGEASIISDEPNPITSPISQQLLTLLMLMLSKDPSLRPSAEEILDSDVIESLTLSFLDKRELLMTNDSMLEEEKPKTADLKFIESLPLKLDQIVYFFG